MDARTRMIIRLYRNMPGAPHIPYDHGSGDLMWGDVEGTDHWSFCEAIVNLIISQTGEPRT